MINPLHALLAPADPVVAVHDRPESVRRALATLADAGFHGRMLSVVARRCPLQELAEARQAGGGRSLAQRLSTSGLVWGVLWSGLAIAFLLQPQAGLAGVGALLALGAMFLVTQLAVVATRVAPRAGAQAAWQPPTPAHGAYVRDLDADRVLVVVDGSRSEQALARAILASQPGA